MARPVRMLGSRIPVRNMFYPLVIPKDYKNYDPKEDFPFKSVNRVKDYQKFYQIRGNDVHIYRRGTYDVIWYRLIMTFALCGTGFVFQQLYLFAMGTLPKKER